MSAEYLSQIVQIYAAFSIGIGAINLIMAGSLFILHGSKDPDRNARIVNLYLASCANTLLGIALKLMTM